MNSARLITIFISFDVRISGEISSFMPSWVKSTFLFLINSGFDILAIVFLAPNCFANKHEVIFTDSLAVTPTNKSALEIFALFNIDIEVQSPSTTLMSS